MWNKTLSKTRLIAYTAVMLALDVVANIFSIPLFGSNYLSFTYAVCFISAVYLGLVPTVAISVFGDILGWLIAPQGAYNPFVGISSLLIGLLPSLILMLPNLNKYVKIAISFVVCAIVCTAGINTYGLWWMYAAAKGKTFWVYLGRLPFQLIMVVVNAIIVFMIVRLRIIDKLIDKGNSDESNYQEKM